MINDTNSFGTKLPQGDHKVRKSQATLTVFRPGFFNLSGPAFGYGGG